jgi:hypothetical protein
MNATRKGGPKVEKMQVMVFHEEASKIIGGLDNATLPQSKAGSLAW